MQRCHNISSLVLFIGIGIGVGARGLQILLSLHQDVIFSPCMYVFISNIPPFSVGSAASLLTCKDRRYKGRNEVTYSMAVILYAYTLAVAIASWSHIGVDLNFYFTHLI